jgi:hypothetical protein
MRTLRTFLQEQNIRGCLTSVPDITSVNKHLMTSVMEKCTEISCNEKNWIGYINGDWHVVSIFQIISYSILSTSKDWLIFRSFQDAGSATEVVWRRMGWDGQQWCSRFVGIRTEANGAYLKAVARNPPREAKKKKIPKTIGQPRPWGDPVTSPVRIRFLLPWPCK